MKWTIDIKTDEWLDKDKINQYILDQLEDIPLFQIDNLTAEIRAEISKVVNRKVNKAYDQYLNQWVSPQGSVFTKEGEQEALQNIIKHYIGSWNPKVDKIREAFKSALKDVQSEFGLPCFSGNLLRHLDNPSFLCSSSSGCKECAVKTGELLIKALE